ncbi:MAG: D-alanine--D-alanine ligase [Parcubacteria group bacterium]|nr:D-alanine--D-alanine ligase [Parcubacteria group bacterium]
MRGTIVGVLRGGPSSEHDVSLATGHAILTNLPQDRYTARDIYIDRQGTWHEWGAPTTPERVLPSLDSVIIGLHGEYGEDGNVQRLLERHGVPYTGADSFASSVAMHKVLTKEKAKEHGLLTPKYYFIEPETDIEAAARDIIRKFHQPVIVKPVALGSSVGVSVVGGYQPVFEAIRTLMAACGAVLVEEYIRGREATAGVVERMRGEGLYRLPPVEIVPPPHAAFFDREVKYDGSTLEIVPGRFSKSESDELMRQASLMHEALGLRHYSRSDFMVTPRGIYFLETNTLPGLTSESLLPKSLAAVGVKFPDFLSHIVELSLGRVSV